MEEHDNKYIAADQASEAFRSAMPLLEGYDGIRDFIACTAHGILINAIPRERGGQLLYAAQVALAVLHREPRPPRPPQDEAKPRQTEAESPAPTPPYTQ
jgi:hypothetical protein